jgi:putative transposase
MILKDKKNSLEKNILPTSLSQTSEAVSTSKEKDFKPFWTPHYKELSGKLWLPTKIDSVDSDLIYLNISSKSKEEKSWFSTKRIILQNKSSLEISLPSSLVFPQGYTVSEATNLRSRKIRIYPNHKQKMILKNWFALYRWYYNRTIESIKETKIISFIKQRNLLREKYNYHNNEYPNYKGENVPSRIIDGAIQTCSKNFEINIKKVKSKLIPSFKINFKTIKDKDQSIVLFKDTFSKNKNSFNMKYLGDDIKSIIPFKGKINKDSRLQFNSILNTFELIIPYDKTYISNEPTDGFIGLDPGERTFLTGYSSKQHLLEIGSGACDIVKKINKSIDRLKSKRDKTKNKSKKKSYTKAIARKEIRKRRLKNELHWKTCKLLTDNYNIIALGDLSTKSISSKKNNLNKNSKRSFSFLGFFLFKQRLEYKCKLNGITFCFQDESCTTKTCTRCGFYNDKIRSNKIFSCPACNLVIGRDINAARNIYMRCYIEKIKNEKLYLSDTSSV